MITKKKRTAKPKQEDLKSVAKGIEALKNKRQRIYETLNDRIYGSKNPKKKCKKSKNKS